MNVANDSLGIVSCGILHREIAQIKNRFDPPLAPMFLDSMLHMRPDVLDRALENVVTSGKYKYILLMYGDCSPHMVQLSRQPGVTRPACMNCCEILLGKKRSRQLRKEGVFLFMPEWTLRWKEIFQFELGFTDDNLARDFMQDMMSRLMYLDTGTMEIPYDTLEEIGVFFGMPMDVEEVGLDFLEQYIREGLEYFHHE